MTAPQVGVLLPVRLETRFVAPRGPAGSWRLRVRIIPDAVAVTVHDPVPTTLELERHNGCRASELSSRTSARRRAVAAGACW